MSLFNGVDSDYNANEELANLGVRMENRLIYFE